MKNKFFIKNYVTNIYMRPSVKSEITSQILYGERFLILLKKNNWLKIKTSFDNYTGYIKNKNYTDRFNPSHKILKLKSLIYSKLKNKFYKSNSHLPFASKISIIKKNKKFIEFSKNKWIKKNDVKKINYIETDFKKIVSLFLNVKYLWGGKSFKGLDCSSLIQLFFYFNNQFFPRDTKDQIKIIKRKNHNKFKKGDIIFWKGHVAICLNTKNLIHAYGPEKKVLIMPINDTIKTIEKTANLKVKKIYNIKLCN